MLQIPHVPQLLLARIEKARKMRPCMHAHAANTLMWQEHANLPMDGAIQPAMRATHILQITTHTVFFLAMISPTHKPYALAPAAFSVLQAQ